MAKKERKEKKEKPLDKMTATGNAEVRPGLGRDQRGPWHE